MGVLEDLWVCVLYLVERRITMRRVKRVRRYVTCNVCTNAHCHIRVTKDDWKLTSYRYFKRMTFMFIDFFCISCEAPFFSNFDLEILINTCQTISCLIWCPQHDSFGWISNYPIEANIQCWETNKFVQKCSTIYSGLLWLKLHQTAYACESSLFIHTYIIQALELYFCC